jgi:hypothetical protein
VRDGVGSKGVSISRRNELFLRTGLDSPNQIESVQEITVQVYAISRVCGPGKRSSIEEKRSSDLPDEAEQELGFFES